MHLHGVQKCTEVYMNTVRGDAAATIGWLDTHSYYLLLIIEEAARTDIRTIPLRSKMYRYIRVHVCVHYV